MNSPHVQDLSECHDKALVGGKAANLGKLIRGGFAVPGGFAVTTNAYRAAREEGLGDLRGAGGPVVEAIRSAYRAIGGGLVAVRSSATAEDMSEASMAGQYDTFLDIADEQALLNAVQCCWASVDSPRTRSYLAEHGIDINQVAMAVVVQKLVRADVAGVLFTANPQNGSRGQMLIEASWGVGEAVVSGLVQPDVLRLEHATGRVVSAAIADKEVFIAPGAHEPAPVSPADRKKPCLRASDVEKLWTVGKKAADYFGGPQDIEWAIHDGELFVLQSRPITTLEDAEAYEGLLQSTRAHLRGLLAAGRGPWVLHNIAETLPHPTPLTWSVVQRFMSGAGGFGSMYRQVGFEPSKKVCDVGFLENICGKAYMDLSMASELFFEGYPFRYDPEMLRSNPEAAQAPPTVATGTAREQLDAMRRASGVALRLSDIAKTLDQELRSNFIPEFDAYCAREKARDLGSLDNAALAQLFREREKKTLDEFAPLSLLPSLIAGTALAELAAAIREEIWDEDAEQLANELASAHPPDKTMLANADLYKVAQGKMVADEWLKAYGHRAPAEFDLATPRWREQRDDLVAMAERLKGGADPLALHERHGEKVAEKVAALRAKLPPAAFRVLEEKLWVARKYLTYREDGKFHLMLGYDILRDAALEAGRRLEIGEDVFLLTAEEMIDALGVGFAPQHLLRQRKVVHKAESRVTLPFIVDAAAIDTLGQPTRLSSADVQKAFAISSGQATGPARIVKRPQDAGDLGKGYILVCPSTDPGWTPLFVNAAGLIIECGGTLSHGAVVAREMNIPAVVLAGATATIPEGQVIAIDGHNGLVSMSGGGTPAEAKAARPDDALKPKEIEALALTADMTPPPPGRRERASGRLRNITLGFWGVYLLLAFLLPSAWVYDPSMALLDMLLWPIVRALGRVGAVAAIAGFLAAATMFGQLWLTDNARLRIAKKRANRLTRLAQKLPAGSAKRSQLQSLAAPVTFRTVMAAFVPLAVLLGPLVMTFLWFPLRLEPAKWASPPGSSIIVTALVDTDCKTPVSASAATPLVLADGISPERQVVPPIRARLEAFYKANQASSVTPDMPLKVQADLRYGHLLALGDLREFLDKGVPPQPLSWTFYTPAGAAGRFTITLSAQGGSFPVRATLGDATAPSDTVIEGPPGSPIKQVKINYDEGRNKAARIFWAPIGGFDIGWMGVYLLAYVPLMFALRFLLRIA